MSFEIQLKQKELDRTVAYCDRLVTEIHAIDTIQSAPKNAQSVIAEILEKPDYASSHFLEDASEVQRFLNERKVRAEDEIQSLADELSKLHWRLYELLKIPDGEPVDPLLVGDEGRDARFKEFCAENSMLRARLFELENTVIDLQDGQ